MLVDLLLAVLDAEEIASAFEREAAIGERKGQRAQIEHVPAKDVALLGLQLAFRNLVHLVGIDSAGKTLERAFRSMCLTAMPGR